MRREFVFVPPQVVGEQSSTDTLPDIMTLDSRIQADLVWRYMYDGWKGGWKVAEVILPIGAVEEKPMAFLPVYNPKPREDDKERRMKPPNPWTPI